MMIRRCKKNTLKNSPQNAFENVYKIIKIQLEYISTTHEVQWASSGLTSQPTVKSSEE